MSKLKGIFNFHDIDDIFCNKTYYQKPLSYSHLIFIIQNFVCSLRFSFSYVFFFLKLASYFISVKMIRNICEIYLTSFIDVKL